MKSTESFFGYVGVLVTLIFLLPFFFATQYTYLSADDFCRTNMSLNEYLGNFSIWYNNITGRYFNYFLVYLPIYKLVTYRITLGLLFISLWGSIFFFIKKFTQQYHLRLRFYHLAIIAGLMFVCIIINLPSPYEFFYWYAATSVYLVSVVLFLLLLGSLINDKIGFKAFLFISICIICLNGNNEMFLLLNTFILLIVTALYTYNHQKINKYLILLNLINWISVIVVIASPASAARQLHYDQSGILIDSVIKAILSTGMLFLKEIFNFSNFLVFITVILIVVSSRFTIVKSKYVIHPLLMLLITFISLTIVLLVPYYATGSLNVNKGRIGNLIQIFVVIFLFINTINLIAFLKWKDFKIGWPINKRLWLIPFFVFFVYISLSNKNYQLIFKDLDGGELSEYDNKIQNRIHLLSSHHGNSLYLDKINPPSIFRHWEVSINKEDWSFKCYKDYLSREYGVEMDSLIIKEN